MTVLNTRQLDDGSLHVFVSGSGMVGQDTEGTGVGSCSESFNILFLKVLK